MTQPSASPILSVQNLDFTVGDLNILRDISLSVQEKEFVCIVGASGCGKTTLLRMMGGLLTPTAGCALYRGQTITGPQP